MFFLNVKIKSLLSMFLKCISEERGHTCNSPFGSSPCPSLLPSFPRQPRAGAVMGSLPEDFRVVRASRWPRCAYCASYFPAAGPTYYYGIGAICDSCMFGHNGSFHAVQRIRLRRRAGLLLRLFIPRPHPVAVLVLQDEDLAMRVCRFLIRL